MSVKICAVESGSIASELKISAGDTLISINGNVITDVLDYGFYQNSENILLKIADKSGNEREYEIVKDEYEELGLIFETYLMDKKRSCKNKCIFCFIDQLPKGLRDTLYFKDDDSRLSFLFGNYITLTNITDSEIDRIIKMHISPINISVHTTNPELRVKMMSNKNAGEALKAIWRLNDAGIKMNCQLVLCPEYNDGKELERTLFDLTELENVECIAAVPVGLTKYREGLTPLKPFDKISAENVLKIIDKYGDKCVEKYGDRRCYGADEFYLLAQKKIPDAKYYGDFLQLENGVGLWALLKSEAEEALEKVSAENNIKRKVTIATGVAAYPLISEIAKKCEEKFDFLSCNVYAIKNNFFGEKITVAGLVTATDIIDQLKGKDLGDQLIIPSCMLRSERDMFLDGVTVSELSDILNINIAVSDNGGYELIYSILGE